MSRLGLHRSLPTRQVRWQNESARGAIQVWQKENEFLFGANSLREEKNKQTAESIEAREITTSGARLMCLDLQQRNQRRTTQICGRHK
jgi:hypothetical protein